MTFGYTADRPVLRGFDLVVRPGETVCLFGPSGVGKSTVLALALRLWDVDAGRSCSAGSTSATCGSTVCERPRVRAAGSLAAGRHPRAEHRLRFPHRDPGRGARGRARRRGRRVRLRLPLGYDQPLGEGAATLSGGQRRRVAIARAAVSAASVLLLDEPTASLDAVSAQRVMDAIRAAARHRTTVIVTHDPALAAVADRVILLAPGEDDRPRQICTTRPR